ncbi:hypothetical protein FB45DRAFT_941054, partial [Roridomyces roridus]
MVAAQPLRVSIVGAGIGGLTAAIALKKNGHIIQVFEATEDKQEIGAGLGLQTNALRVLEHLGVRKENLRGLDNDGSVMYDSCNGQGRTFSFSSNNGVLCHRSDLYEELKRLAMGDGDGAPVKLRLGCKVVGCDTEKAAVTLENGEVIEADVVIGADGINSLVRAQILGHVQEAPYSGWSCLRTVFDAANMHEIPELEWINEGVSGVNAILVKETPFRRWIVYPIRDRSLINTVTFYTDSPGDKTDCAPTKEEVLERYKDFDPKFLRLFDLPVHSPLRRWRMRVVPQLPTWVAGRAALLGDAAHGTVPMFAQGAGMAIEEAVALQFLLPLGTKREDVPARLQAYFELRKDRGELIRQGSVDQISKVDFTAHDQLRLYDAIEASRAFYEERFGSGSLRFRVSK